MNSSKQTMDILDHHDNTLFGEGGMSILGGFPGGTYLTYLQNTSWEILGWMSSINKTAKMESRLLEEISITSDMQMTPPLSQKVKRN